MAIDIRTIGTVKHKDGSTEDVTWFGKNFEGSIIFETLQGNRYLYHEYCDEYDISFNNSLFHKRCDQFYKFDYELYEWIDANHIIDNITITNN